MDSSIFCQLSVGGCSQTTYQILFDVTPARMPWLASVARSQLMDKYSDKEHIISQLAEDHHGDHLQGETLPENPSRPLHPIPAIYLCTNN